MRLFAWINTLGQIRLFITDEHHPGLVVVTNQLRVPLVLRRRGTDYMEVEPCSVIGRMDGEAFQTYSKVDTFKII